MVVGEKLYTADEFFEWVQSEAYTDRRLELVTGVIVEMPPSRPINTIVAWNIARIVGNYVVENDLGYMSGADGGYRLSADTVRQPDAAFVSKERYASIPEVFEGGPDLAIEVISPREDALGKATEYLEAGTRLVWAIYPIAQKVHILRPTEPRWTILTVEDTLTGGEVLPGFSVPVREIFPD